MASAVSVYMSGDQNIPSGSAEVLEFDSELYDEDGEFNTSTFTFTPLVAGKYLVIVQATFYGDSANENMWVDIRVDGTSMAKAQEYVYSNADHTINVSQVVDLTTSSDVTGTVTVLFVTDDNVYSSSLQTFMTIIRLQ